MLNEQTGEIVAVASTVGNGIKQLGDTAFTDWLRATVGQLQATNTDLYDALAGLRAPIATTNYDTLLADHLGQEPVSWDDVAGMQEILASDKFGIAHFHGVWNKPNSIVLTETDYAMILAADGVQALERGILGLKSFVFVGFGSGLSDPNFSRLLHWHRRVFSESRIDSYRLCRERDKAALETTHVDDKIVAISYGSDYDDLLPFLKSLALPEVASVSATGMVRDTQADARESILGDLRTESIIAEHSDDIGLLGLDELLLAPTLLQLPDSHYVKAAEGGEKIEPLNIVDELALGGIIILAAEENTGLSTAIKWLLVKSCEHHEAAPILVSARAFTPGARTLERATRQEAHLQGLIERIKDPLPRLALAVDDFNPHVTKIADHAFKDMSSIQTELLILGCRQGEETEIAERLAALGVQSRVRYLAKLRSKSVAQLARMASPVRYETIAAGVISIMRAERLPFTPFTASLLISILIRGNIVVVNASSTTVLEQYLELLLGRGDEYEDERFSLSSAQLMTILSDFARLLVERLEGSVSEAEAVARLETFFDQRGWRESPMGVLRNLIDRRVLKEVSGQIAFSQSSYVHLFAAKRATRDEALLEILADRPLYFSPILRDYAALARDDAKLLQTLNLLLDGWSDRDVRESEYGQIEVREAPADLEDSVETAASEIEDARENDEVVDSNLLDAESESREEALEAIDDRDLTPFPLTSEDGLSDLARHMTVLDLVSAVLRDTDDLEDVRLKKTVLYRILQSWGELVNTFEDDETFANGVRDILRDIEESYPDATEDEAEEGHGREIESLIGFLPAALVAGGISTALSTRKLVVPLEEVIDAKGDDALDARGAFAAAILIADIAEPSWAQAYADIVKSNIRVKIFQRFMLPYTLYLYATSNSRTEQAILSELAADMQISKFKFKDSAAQKRYRSKLLQNFRHLKDRERGRDELVEGSSA